MSDFRDPDDFFQEFIRLAGRIFDETILSDRFASAGEVPMMQRGEADEVIMGRGEITYILHAPGYSPEDFLVSILDDVIEVKTKDFVRRRALGSRVLPDNAITTYRNGMLSVRIKRKEA